MWHGLSTAAAAGAGDNKQEGAHAGRDDAPAVCHELTNDFAVLAI